TQLAVVVAGGGGGGGGGGKKKKLLYRSFSKKKYLVTNLALINTTTDQHLFLLFPMLRPNTCFLNFFLLHKTHLLVAHKIIQFKCLTIHIGHPQSRVYLTYSPSLDDHEHNMILTQHHKYWIC
ncbi:hypothetical protein ACJX0J_036290, partial [Zea mays]